MFRGRLHACLYLLSCPTRQDSSTPASTESGVHYVCLGWMPIQSSDLLVSEFCPSDSCSSSYAVPFHFAADLALIYLDCTNSTGTCCQFESKSNLHRYVQSVCNEATMWRCPAGDFGEVAPEDEAAGDEDEEVDLT